MRKLLVASQKGGVGKTTTAINLAVATARADEGRVLLVDTDPLHSVAAALDLPEPTGTLRDAGFAIDSPMWPSPISNLDIASAYPHGRAPTDERLAEFIQGLLSEPPENDYSWVVFDSTPMAAGRQVRHLLAVADELVLVLRSEPLAFRTLPNFLELLKSVQANGSPVTLRGLLLTLPPGEPLGGRWESDLRRYFQQFILPQAIPFDPEVSKSVLAARPVVELNPNAPASLQYRGLAQALVLIRANADVIDLFDGFAEDGSTIGGTASAGAAVRLYDSENSEQEQDTATEDEPDPIEEPSEDLPPEEEPKIAGASDAGEPTGHAGDVTAIAFSPDGTKIATASWDKTIRIWDAATGRQLRTLKGHGGRVSGVTFARGGEQIISAGWDKTARVWDVETGQELRAIEGHKGAVTAVCEIPGQSSVATASWDKTVRVWYASSGRELASLAGHDRMVTAIASSPDGHLLASGAWDKTVRLWKSNGEAVATFRGHTGDVSSVAFAPDGGAVASAATDKSVRLWKVDPSGEHLTLRGHTAEVHSVTFSPDGTRIASGSADRTVRLWDAETGELVATLEGHDGVVNTVAFDPVGGTLASCGLDGVVKFWEHDGRPTREFVVREDVTAEVPTARPEVSVEDVPLPSPPSDPAQTADLFGSPPDEFSDQLSSMGSAGGRPLSIEGESKIEDIAAEQFQPEPEPEPEPETIADEDDEAESGETVPRPAASEGLSSLAIAPDGSLFATSSSDGSILLWDATRRRVVRSIRAGPGAVEALAFSADSGRLASGGRDGSIRVWDAMTGKELSHLEAHAAAVTALAFDPEGRWLASGSWDHTIRLWDVSVEGAEGPALTGHEDGVTALAFVPGQPILVSGGEDTTVRVWDLGRGGDAVMTLHGHERGVNAVAVNHSGQIASVDGAGVLKMWDLAGEGEEEFSVAAHDRMATSVAFSPEGSALACGGWDGQTVLLNMNTGRELFRFYGAGRVTGVGFLQAGDLLLVSGSDGAVRLWDVFTGDTVSESYPDPAEWSAEPRALPGDLVDTPLDGVSVATATKRPEADPEEDGPPSSIFLIRPDPAPLSSTRIPDAVPLSPNQIPPSNGDTEMGHVLRPTPEPEDHRPAAVGQILLAAAGEEGRIVVWDLETAAELSSWQGHSADVNSVAFLPGGRSLVAGSSDQSVRLWDLETGSGQTLGEHSGEVTAVACSQDGNRIASGSWDQTVRIWDARSGEELLRLHGHRGAVTAIAFSPDGATLASASWDKTVKLWDVNTGQEVTTLKGHEKMVTTVVFAPNGRTIASGSWDKTAKLWDIESSQAVLTLRGHGFAVSAVAFTPEGTRLVTGSWDMTVRMWDLTYGDERRIFRGHTESIRSISLAADGQTLATGSWDGTVRVWDLSLDAEQGILKAPTTRVHSVAFAPTPAGAGVAPTEDPGVRSV